jgi:glyoxylase-like metal-dependent hydrolase (beta-lactamase superfamily II)
MGTSRGGTVHRIADRCFQLHHSRGANGYVVAGDGRAAVIDPGLASGFSKLRAELRDSEALTGPITDIVLTHYDADHSGAAAKLQRELGAPVWLASADAAILRRDTAAPTGVRRFVSTIMRVEYPDDVREFDGTVQVFPGLEGFPTPGHTPGHTAFDYGTVLFVGDSVSVSKGGALRQFSLAPLISDKRAAVASQRLLEERIASRGIEWICAGHSRPARAQSAG